jgi:histidine triad (HIT) family protein
MSNDCIFCKIVQGVIPSTPVAQSDTAYAIYDLAPQAPVHVLIIPKAHIASADHVGPEHPGIMNDLVALAQEVADREGVRESGYRLVMNVGADAQMTVEHLHMHLMGGRLMHWPAG